MILIFIGFFSGLISGMGIGGGSILIPSLVLITGISQQDAQGINLLVFIPIAIIALITHYKKNNLEFSISRKLIPLGILGSILGSILAIKINGEILRKCFGIFLLFIGIYEVFKKKE